MLTNGNQVQQYDQYGLPLINGVVKKNNNIGYNYNFNTQNSTAGSEPEKAKAIDITVDPLKKDDVEPGFVGQISDGLGSLFKPSGESGTSMFGSVMGGLGKGFDIYQGLGQIKLAKKQAELNEKIAEREAQKDARLARAYEDEEKRKVQLAKNVGNGAFYA
mgnify:CR=1 FL=1